MFIWIKSQRQLRRLTPRQLRDYYEKQLRDFFTARYMFGERRSPTFFEGRHAEAGTLLWRGRAHVRKVIGQLKEIRAMLRDGYRRELPRAKGAVGACAVDREEERPKRVRKEDRR